MKRIISHPVLPVSEGEPTTFLFNGVQVSAIKGFTIAAALHQAGFPVHSHSVRGRNRSLNCGIGKCGACEMMVDGETRRICITKVDDVREVIEAKEQNFIPEQRVDTCDEPIPVYRTDVAIVGAGPAGLACRETLKELGIHSIVVDSNDCIGGQFLMQTHAFFFFEKEKRFGGMRGFDIARTLAGDSQDGIFLNSTVWDILDDGRIAVKDLKNKRNFYIEPQALVVATGAVPFMPAFENDDVPGVYTAAVVQKMMNTEFTLLGKNVLTVGAGNIGYLTSYQLMQAGASVKAIIEAMPREGGFPVQAKRVRRLGIPVMTSRMLLRAIPNEDYSGITGAVIAECANFKAIPGTEMVLDGIDAINICTGLLPDNQLLSKGELYFGKKCVGIGDAVRIGEGTTAVLRGKQAAYELAQELGVRFDYQTFLNVSKEYIESQQHPVRIKEKPSQPESERAISKPFVMLDCLYGFACNPCAFSCKYGAITKSSAATTPEIDYSKCIGCMDCVSQCPGLAIFGYDLKKQLLTLPVEFDVKEGCEVWLVDNTGLRIDQGVVEKIVIKKTKTNLARIKVAHLEGEDLTQVSGFIPKYIYPEKISLKPYLESEAEGFVCHCEDVSMSDLLEMIGNRKFISIDEVKHVTRLGMGPCRGKRCISRLRMKLREKGIELVGDATPRAPMSTRMLMKDIYPKQGKLECYTVDAPKEVRETEVLIAGGGIAGSALYRYFAEAGKKVVLVNVDRGASWRAIGGGRPAFSVPELSEIAVHNQEIFKEIQTEYNIHYRETRYITFAHDEATYRSLENSCSWSNAYLIDKKDFMKEVSPYFNPNQQTYFAAQVSQHCWQASPGRVVDFIRWKGNENGGLLMEDTRVVEVHKEGEKFHVLLMTHDQKYVEYICEHFVNALGYNAEHFARMLGLYTGLYSVKHQALITQRLPRLGKEGDILDMLIDRRKRNDFSAVYGQQFAETGQIIACASPAVDAKDSIHRFDDLKFNTRAFMEIVSEVFNDWIPAMASVPLQSTWAGYYVEPRYIIDPANGLFVGMQGHGFMLSQYLAKLYVDKVMGRVVPEFMERLTLDGVGISEKAFK